MMLLEQVVMNPDAIAVIIKNVTRVNKLRAKQGEQPVLNLGVGEPYHFINEEILQDLQEYLQQAKSHFSFNYLPAAGSTDVRNAIVRLYKYYYPRLDYQRREVMITLGASQGLAHAFRLLIAPRDKVLIFEPYFSLYRQQIELLQGELVKIGTQQCNFKPNANLLRQALRQHPASKVLVLNYPNNPSGINLTASEWRELAQVLREHPHLTIILDEVYRELSLQPHCSLLDIAPDLKDRCVVINSASKGLVGGPGFRLGMVGANAAWIKQMAVMQGADIVSPPVISERVLMVAIDRALSDSIGYHRWLTTVKADYARNMAYLSERLSALGFEVVPGGNGLFLLVNAQGFIQQLSAPLHNDLEVAEYLLNHAGVATVPGSGFGIDASACYLRISCARPMDILEQAIDALQTLRVAHNLCGLRKG